LSAMGVSCGTDGLVTLLVRGLDARGGRDDADKRFVRCCIRETGRIFDV
jgi:hypothetical protein